MTWRREGGELPGWVEMIPTSLLELPNRIQDPEKLPKHHVFKTNVLTEEKQGTKRPHKPYS